MMAKTQIFIHVYAVVVKITSAEKNLFDNTSHEELFHWSLAKFVVDVMTHGL